MKSLLFGLILLPLGSTITLANESNKYCNLHIEELAQKINYHESNLRFSYGPKIKIFPENLTGAQKKLLQAIKIKKYDVSKQNDASVSIGIISKCLKFDTIYYFGGGFSKSFCESASWKLTLKDLNTNEVYEDSTIISTKPVLFATRSTKDANDDSIKAKIIESLLPECQ